MRSFAEIFKSLRLEKGITQDQISRALGITKQAVSHYERGTREPKQEMLEAIADYFNVDINYLLGFEPTIKTPESLDFTAFLKSPVTIPVTMKNCQNCSIHKIT